MKSHVFRVGLLLLSLLCVGVSGAAWAKSPPVAMLTQVTGTVEYSKDGALWKAVQRNKFLFSGYQVRTQKDGGGRLIIQSSGMARDLGPESHVELLEKEVKVLSGVLSEPEKVSGGLLSSLDKKFSKAQRYTTTRRSAGKNQKLDVSFIRKVTLSEKYPDLVWENPGADYAYRLIVDGRSVTVPGAAGEMVRHTFSGLTPGVHGYRIELWQGDKPLYRPRKDREIVWLSAEEMARVEQGLAELEAAAPGDPLLRASYLEDNGLTVAAMDLYRSYFADNADDTEMLPLLIKTYHDLKLDGLKKAEVARYNQQLAAE